MKKTISSSIISFILGLVFMNYMNNSDILSDKIKVGNCVQITDSPTFFTYKVIEIRESKAKVKFTELEIWTSINTLIKVDCPN